MKPQSCPRCGCAIEHIAERDATYKCLDQSCRWRGSSPAVGVDLASFYAQRPNNDVVSIITGQRMTFDDPKE